ncbi:MAG: hypothetical protein MHM6MM_006073 [Cercozoa sp. M6MM]
MPVTTRSRGKVSAKAGAPAKKVVAKKSAPVKRVTKKVTNKKTAAKKGTKTTAKPVSTEPHQSEEVLAVPVEQENVVKLLIEHCRS